MRYPALWVEADVQANGIRLHYYRTGGDKRQVVLAHGYSDQALCWLSVARALQSAYDVILYDARGHGLSEAPEHGYSYTDRAADLAGLITSLELKRPALLGHSMGAQAVAVCSSTNPGAMSAALLEDPPWMDPEEASRRGRVRDAGWLARERDHIIERRQHTLDAQIAFEQGMNADWSAEDTYEAAVARLMMSPNNAETIADPPPSWRDIARHIQCPTLLMTGLVQRGALVTPELSAEALSLLPPSSEVVSFESGHSIHRVVFDEFMSTVTGFLSKTA